MSRPHVHKNRLLKYMTKVREEISIIEEHKHIEFPYKSLNEVEIDIHKLTQEIERRELAK